MKEKFKRSLIKTISWRITGSIDTVIISLIITGDLSIATTIGFVEVFTKMILYFIHERVWNRISYGKEISNHIEFRNIGENKNESRDRKPACRQFIG